MPTQDEVMQQIVQLVGTGAEMPLTGESESGLRARYFTWIVTKKADAPSSPLDAWDGSDGKDLQKKFKAIGKCAAQKAKDQKKDKIDRHDCGEACTEIETTSDCPYCPDPIDI
ncbi:MAG TPA: hypothetical protein VLT87_16705 [Thermoanaerobaculia bacterium]|nr:hypothetical protein [Thermoanaerobaculia bacterium]